MKLWKRAHQNPAKYRKRLVKQMVKGVNKGAAWLDENKPEWYTLINPQALEMNDGHSCILGQVFMDEFNEAISDEGMPRYLSGFDYADELLLGDPLQVHSKKGDYIQEVGQDRLMGFNVPPDYSSSLMPQTKWLWEVLAELWIRKIKERVNAF